MVPIDRLPAPSDCRRGPCSGLPLPPLVNTALSSGPVQTPTRTWTAGPSFKPPGLDLSSPVYLSQHKSSSLAAAMLRALTRLTIVPRQAHRSNAITQHRLPPLGSWTTAHTPNARANYTPPTILSPSRAALLAYFRECPDRPRHRRPPRRQRLPVLGRGGRQER